MEMEEERSTRNVRWKLRSSVKRSTNYCEESSDESSESASESEEEESEVENIESIEINSGDDGDFEETPKKVTKGLKKLEPKKVKGRGREGNKSKKNKYKKAKRSTSTGGSPKEINGKGGKKEQRSIASYFGGKSAAAKEEKEKEAKKRRIDPETRAFLDSGVPEVVVRAQKVVEKKKEEDQHLSTLGFFPKISQVSQKDDIILNDDDMDTDLNADSKLLKLFEVKSKLNSAVVGDEVDGDLIIQSTAVFSTFLSNKQKKSSVGLISPFCCKEVPNLKSLLISPRNEPGIVGVRKKNDKDVKKESVTSNSHIPWIDKYKVEKLKSLVGDRHALNKLHKWVKEWKRDIKDDGGTSRKLIEKKKKRRDSDSDFITSEDEEDEFKKKSVLLAGPPGSGKTAAVYVIAQHLGFHVVEVNFSTRRSGKEVLQRVEEAVVSHRLQSSQNCLLLFKDIELLNAEEDEGFHAAVAQLITTAVRPIVMTTGQRAYDALDPKIEKKDPLRISFCYPKPSRIVDKILIPILQMEREGSDIFPDSPNNNNNNNSQSQNSKNDCSPELISLLTSLTRHAGSDIRQVINQVQFLFSSQESDKDKKMTISNYDGIHEHLTGGNQLLLDLGFVIPKMVESEECEDEDLVSLSVKGRKRKELKDLEKSAETLGSLCDLDCMERWMDGSLDRNQVFQDDEHREDERRNRKFDFKSNYSSPNFISHLNTNYIKESDETGLNLIRKLTYENDEEITKSVQISKLREESGEFFNVGGDGLWDSVAWLRTIVKQNVMDSVGRLTKRNGRMTYYFNRMDRKLIDSISNTFGFQDDLEIAKSIAQQNDS